MNLATLCITYLAYSVTCMGIYSTRQYEWPLTGQAMTRGRCFITLFLALRGQVCAQDCVLPCHTTHPLSVPLCRYEQYSDYSGAQMIGYPSIHTQLSMFLTPQLSNNGHHHIVCLLHACQKEGERVFVRTVFEGL